MKLSVKLISGFFVVALLVGFVGIVGITSNNTIQKNNEIGQEIRELMEDLDDIFKDVLQLIGTENLDDYREIKSSIGNTRKEFDVLHGKNDEIIHTLEGFETFDNDIEEFTKIYNGIIAVHKNKLFQNKEFIEKQSLGRSTEEIVIEQKKIEAEERLKVQQLREIIDKLEESEERIVNTIRSESKSLAMNTTRTLLIVILISFIGSIVLGLYISRSISKPITKLRDSADKISKGNLAEPIGIKDGDEIVELAEVFDDMRYSLKRVIEEYERQRGGIEMAHKLEKAIGEERKAQEKLSRLASVVEHSNDFVAIANPKGEMLYVNKTGLKMMGLKDMSKLKTIKDVHPKESYPIMNKTVAALKSKGDWKGELPIKNFKTGKPIPTDFHAFIIKDDKGRPIAMAAIAR